MLKWTTNHCRTEIDFLPKRSYPGMIEMRNLFRTPQSHKTPADQKARRKSLSILRTRLQEHKENLQTNFLRRSLGSSSSPLLDISNGQSPNRTPRTPGRRVAQRQFARTLPTYEAEESPDMFHPIAPRIRPSPQASLSSSQIGDTTLDRLIDAIIESAKKEFPGYEPGNDSSAETSVHEMEVKTPEGCHHLKRQRVVRRKTKPTEHEPTKNSTSSLTIPNGIPSPESPQTSNPSSEKRLELANMETPENMTFVVDSFPGIFSKSLQGCSTPSPSKTNSIKRCLHFSPEDMEDSDVDGSLNEKRKSVASSTSSSSISINKNASIDLAIFAENGKLNVHGKRLKISRPTFHYSENLCFSDKMPRSATPQWMHCLECLCEGRYTSTQSTPGHWVPKDGCAQELQQTVLRPSV